MSIEEALLTQAAPWIAISKLREKIKLRDDINCRYQDRCDEALLSKHDDFIKLQIWISPDQKFDWIQSELFLKQIKTIRHRSIFEVCGNKDRIVMSIKTHMETSLEKGRS
jgi:hypothetical protein